MSKPRVFISHSTGALSNTDRSAMIRECLYASLSNKDWDVFLDLHDIEPGMKWRVEILHNLAEAHSGIILFNERAVSKSKWVADEALILCFRKSIDPDFQVIPVLLDGKCLNDTCFENYEPFQLNEIQYIKDDETLTAEEFAELIASKLDLVRPKQPPMSPWVHRVVGLLHEVHISALQDAAMQLELTVEGDLWNRAGDRKRDCLCRAVVELMHHRPSLDSVGAFSELLLGLKKEGVDIFLKYLTAKWVANEAAQIILYASHKPEEKGLLIINSGEQVIIDEYVNRALIEINSNPGSVWPIYVGGCAGEGDDAIIYQIERAIQARIIKPPHADNIEKLPQDVAKIMKKPNDIAICALPPEYAKEGVLSKLRQRYPKIIFLVQVGRSGDLNRFKAIRGIALPKLDDEKIEELSELKSRLEAAIFQKSLIH